MIEISASDAQKDFLSLLELVNDDQTTVEIISENGNAVLQSKSDYDSMVETAYLMSSPANAHRLLNSMEAVQRGEHQERDLLE